MIKIAMIGAGSAVFLKNLLTDVLDFPELREVKIALHDIDPERLETAGMMARWTARQFNANVVLPGPDGTFGTPDDVSAPREDPVVVGPFADLIPLVGATLGAIAGVIGGFAHSVTAGIIVIVFFIVYQQLENHLLQPLVYSRTVQLSPLAILIAVLIGAELAGILGALAAIPVAGTIQILIVEWLDIRRERQFDRQASTRCADIGERAVVRPREEGSHGLRR